MARLRLGVALLVPEPARTEIDALRRATGDQSLDRVPAHLTLVPPVNVHERDLDAALQMVRDAAAETSIIVTYLGPPGSFLPDNPVLHLPVTGGAAAVEALRERVFRPPLERRLAWPFVPHVTLCDEAHPARIEAAVEALAGYRLTVAFERVHVLREERRADGRRVWTPLTGAAFEGRRTVSRGGPMALEITESDGLDPHARAFTDRQWTALQHERDYRWEERPLALTARRGGEVVGVARGWTNEGVAHLGELMVASEVRAEGIGGHLLAAFEDLAVQRGCRRLSLETDADGPARAFYEARGWVVEATLTDWVDGQTMAHMRKDL